MLLDLLEVAFDETETAPRRRVVAVDHRSPAERCLDQGPGTDDFCSQLLQAQGFTSHHSSRRFSFEPSRRDSSGGTHRPGWARD